MKILLFISFCFFSFQINVNAQIITTIAGTGSGSYSGDGDIGTATSLVVHCVCTDMYGNIYIVARENNRVCKIDATGIVTTVAGGGSVLGDGGPATAAQLNDPNMDDVDRLGNLYISDGTGNRIRMVNPAGIITTIAGTGTAGISGDGGPATVAEIDDAYGIKIDAIGNIYFADSYNNRIRKIDTSGIITTLAGSGPSGLPSGAFSGDGGPATAAQLSDPTGLCLDSYGNIFFTDDDNNRIRKIDTAGIITTIAGTGTASFSGDGGAAATATFYTPFDIAIDGCGNLYIADNNNNCIRKINTSGVITTIAGIGASAGGFSGDGGPATAAVCWGPSGIGFDTAGNLLESDYYNNRLRIISPLALTSGIITGIDSVCHGLEVRLTDTISGGIWSSSNTSVSTVNGSGVVTGVASGQDTIGYTITSSGCTIQSFFSFKVSDTTVCNKELVTLTNNKESVSVYPNPSYSGQFTVNVISWENGLVHIYITTMMGALLKEVEGSTNDLIEISMQLPDGVYFVSISTAISKWNTRLIVDNH